MAAAAGGRAALTAAVATAIGVGAAVSHLVMDAVAGALDALAGLTTGQVAAVAGAAVALQVLGAVGAVRGRRGGHATVLVLAAAWVVAAAVDHPGAFVPGEFAGGAGARAAVLLLVAAQVVAAVAALSALRSTRRTSFRGTGSFGS